MFKNTDHTKAIKAILDEDTQPEAAGLLPIFIDGEFVGEAEVTKLVGYDPGTAISRTLVAFDVPNEYNEVLRRGALEPGFDSAGNLIEVSEVLSPDPSEAGHTTHPPARPQSMFRRLKQLDEKALALQYPWLSRKERRKFAGPPAEQTPVARGRPTNPTAKK